MTKQKNSIPYKPFPDKERKFNPKKMEKERMYVKIDKTEKEPERKFISKLWGGFKKTMIKSLLPELKKQIKWDLYFEKDENTNTITAGVYIEVMGEVIVNVERTKTI